MPTKFDQDIKKDDTFASFDFQIVKTDGTAIDVSGASPIDMYLKKPGEAAFAAGGGTVTVLDGEGRCSYAYDGADTDTSGTLHMECRFTLSGRIGTSPGDRFFLVRIHDH